MIRPLRRSRSPDSLFSPPLSYRGAPPHLRSGILGFRSEVSGGESRRVRTAWVSPMVQYFSFVLGVPVVLVLLGVCSRVSGSACDTGWVFSAAFLSLYGRDWELCGRLLVSAHSWVIGCPSGNGVWELVRSHSRSGGVALEFLSPHLIKMRAWRWRSSALHPLGFSVSVVLDRARPRAAASEGLTILAAAAAFTQQLLLFHFHSADHMGVEGQYHFILQLIIFVSLITTLMEENFDIAEMCHRCYEPEVEAEAYAVQNKMAEARGGGGAKLLKTAVFRRLV
ncbi:hypothetical protein Bca52824_038971 [Brassica carinata]|uniref:Uncharacterized protein n=1 Tax=Brassica carinata TaxID=52824 RepID=A0A8X7RQI6_BRACI|nr:hypothetical protein Bca52824_038971 [Brassica carinata]